MERTIWNLKFGFLEKQDGEQLKGKEKHEPLTKLFLERTQPLFAQKGLKTIITQKSNRVFFQPRFALYIVL